jgi:hypothetical protein
MANSNKATDNRKAISSAKRCKVSSRACNKAEDDRVSAIR